jgi:hypothetical protein
MNEDEIGKMIDDLQKSSIEKAQRMVREGAPETAKRFLALTTKLKDAPLSEQALEALRKLPSTGRIKRKRDIRIVNVVSQVIDEIPDSDPRKSEVIQLFNDALDRSTLA